jgi:hypothetical protein
MRIFARATILGLSLAAALTAGVPKSTDIRRVDFKNFLFPWDEAMAEASSVPSVWRWIDPLPQSHIRAIRGIHHFYFSVQTDLEREHAPLISVDSMTYGDLDGDEVEEAAVHLNYSTGGTSNWDFLYIYKLDRGQPKLLVFLKAARADMVVLCELLLPRACWYLILPTRTGVSVIVAQRATSGFGIAGDIEVSPRKDLESAVICP